MWFYSSCGASSSPTLGFPPTNGGRRIRCSDYSLPYHIAQAGGLRRPWYRSQHSYRKLWDLTRDPRVEIPSRDRRVGLRCSWSGRQPLGPRESHRFGPLVFEVWSWDSCGFSLGAFSYLSFVCWWWATYGIHGHPWLLFVFREKVPIVVYLFIKIIFRD